ncbi:hypothetical protein EMPS_10451 [Entomortierella parvispora]|uniref:Kinetochore protein Sos7 coiled-coil domain-containing protein n=1 Tax=Entomortierella parvispora TaxID=205924 RepID=A0A9P3HKW1_9FUNG|nr:hypothetical protein EMPS_10451 [Entomortierella parvispora]
MDSLAKTPAAPWSALNQDETRRATERNNELKEEYRTMQLYLHGLHNQFLENNKLSKLEAQAGGAAIALTQQQSDQLYYQELFEKYRFNYLEHATKEKFLKQLLADEPMALTNADVQELSTRNDEHRRYLEELELEIANFAGELNEAVGLVYQDYDGMGKDHVQMTKMLHEMQEMEAELAQLKTLEDKYMGMTISDSQNVLENLTRELHQVHQEKDEVTSNIQDLKWQESQLQERNQKLAAQRIQTEARAKEAVKMSAFRQPEIEAAYKECLEITKRYQDGVGLESIQFLNESSSLLLEYRITPGSATVHTVPGLTSGNSNKVPQSKKSGSHRKAILTQFLIRLHPQSGRLLSVSIENAGCDVKDVIQIAKTRNDISFLVTETLDRIMKAHP